MKRSRTISDTRRDSAGSTPAATRRGEGMEILHNIASFLTLSDAASLYSFPNIDDGYEEAEEELSIDSWAIGEGYDPPSCGSALWDLRTPDTPGLVALSPGATPRLDYDRPENNNEIGEDDNDEVNSQEETEYMEMILREKRRRWAQQKLAAAVFAHPGSLRSFCLDAYQAAVGIRHKQEQSATPELDVPLPTQRRMATRRTRRRMIINAITDFVLHNLPVSVLIDVLEAVGEVSLDTTFASFRLTTKAMNAIVRGLVHVVTTVWECIINFNPFQLLETVVSFQFNAMEKTSEALATGIQSVATGMGSAMGSASNMALHRLNNANLSSNKSASTGSLLHDSGNRRPRTNGLGINKRLLKKLSSINDAARVVSYMESGDITGGLR